MPQDQASLTAQQEPHAYALMKSTECKKISSGSDEGGGEGHIGGTCKEVSNVGSSSEGGGGRHPGESAPTRMARRLVRLLSTTPYVFASAFNSSTSAASCGSPVDDSRPHGGGTIALGVPGDAQWRTPCEVPLRHVSPRAKPHFVCKTPLMAPRAPNTAFSPVLDLISVTQSHRIAPQREQNIESQTDRQTDATAGA